MKTLLWKDFRQNRGILIALGIFVLIPYVFATLIGVSALWTRDKPLWHWAELWWGASVWSLGVSTVACAFVAGNAIAGERADRSAEFAAYVPIESQPAIVSKAILAFGAWLVVWLANIPVLCIAATGIDWPHGMGERYAAIPISALSALLIFGVSWLFSSYLRNPAIAAACGLATALVLLWVGLSISIDSYFASCLIAGPVCFVLGTSRALQRVES